MSKPQNELWHGLNDSARKAVTGRNYKEGSLAARVARGGVDAAELAAADRRQPDVKKTWIPGVEIFSREIHCQRHRGVFGEFARQEEGVLARIGLWPRQWSAARMFAQTAKGFHVHPPSIPAETTAEKWHRRLFVNESQNYALRPYDREQWDVMFFVQGRVEIILCDCRAGLPSCTMRFFIDGDNHCRQNNVGLVVPPGVAHAVCVEGSEDAIMVYGTSTSFHPEFEGRIASEIEAAKLPESWERFLGERDDDQ
jgi:dTDP-4-dehydrorhamnose 3,5-epimerase-like enzyme